MKKIIETLKSKGLKEVVFEAVGFNITDESGIEDLQVGYGLHPDGSNLTGSSDGD